MTESVTINGASCTYTTEVRDNPAHREAFFALARQVFGLDFAPWHAAGWWSDDRYAPHLLLDEGGHAVANVSANQMAFVLDGAPRRYIQLGTVMTADSHRGRGLAGWLMEQVTARWQGRCDALYLHANAGAAGFYRRFGFVPATQTPVGGPLPAAKGHNAEKPPVRRLDMANPADRETLLRCYAMGNPYSALAFTQNPGLLMFYCDGPMRDCVFYSEAYNTAYVAEYSGEALCLMDIFSPGPAGRGGSGAPLASLLAAAARPGITRVAYGFTPAGTAGLAPLPADPDDVLMIQKGGENAFAARELMFPLLSHA